MNLTVRLITNSSARLAICSAFCWQPMTAKLLQAYLKMYTFAHCLHLYLLGPRTHPTLDLPVVLGAVTGCPSDLLSSLHILKEIRLSESEKEMTEIYWNVWGKAETSFNTCSQYLTVVASFNAIHAGRTILEISLRISQGNFDMPYEGCAESAVPKENSEQVIASYHSICPCISMHVRVPRTAHENISRSSKTKYWQGKRLTFDHNSQI